MLLKQWAEEKKRRSDTSEEKSRRKTKQCYHNGICRWKRDRFSNEVEIKMGIV